MANTSMTAALNQILEQREFYADFMAAVVALENDDEPSTSPDPFDGVDVDDWIDDVELDETIEEVEDYYAD